MFQKLSQMLTLLETVTGKNAKAELLKLYVGDPDFVWMAKLALDQGHSFGVKTFPDFVQTPPGVVVAGGSMSGHIKAHLESMKAGSGVSDSLLAETHKLACLSEDHYKVMTRILRQDLRCGVGADSINRIKPGLIYKVPYQRCGKSEKLNTMTFPALLQRKANGMFAYGLPQLAGEEFMTRQGNEFSIPGNPVTKQHRSNEYLKDKVMIHELLVLDECGCLMERAAANGIINSFIKGEGDAEYADRIRAQAWGYITQEEFRAGLGAESYGVMWGKLEGQLPAHGFLRPIASWVVKSLAEAKAKANELIADGEEGGVLKSLDPKFVWKDEDPCNFQFKLKAEATCEFEIIDAYYGEPGKKYEKFLGGIRVRSADGLIESDCGGGFKDVDRKRGVDHWLGKKGEIVSITFNGITTNRDTDKKSLDHPRFEEERSDKKVADTLEYCQDALLGRVKI